MGFQMVPKLLILNDLKRRNGRYFALFHRIPGFEANYVSAVEVRPILSTTKMQPMNPVFDNV